MGAVDRQESEEDERRGVTGLISARDRLATLPAMLPPVAKGSVLDIEDAKTAYQPISSLVQSNRGIAVDALEFLTEAMMNDASGTISARPFAPCALLRQAIEASALARWILRHGKSHERVYRALQVAFGHAEDYANLMKAIAGKGSALRIDENRKKKIDRLDELRMGVKFLRQRELKPPPRLTDILTAVSPARPPGAGITIDSPLLVWKIASAFLHGSEHTVRSLSDIRQATEWEAGIASFELTPNWQLIGSSALICVGDIEALDQRFTELATHDFDGKLC